MIHAECLHIGLSGHSDLNLPVNQSCIEFEDKLCCDDSENCTGVSFVVSLGILLGGLVSAYSLKLTYN